MKKANLNTKIKTNSKVISKKLKRNTNLLDPDRGRVHILNETASFIWEEIRKGVKVRKIIDDIVIEFDVKKEVAQKDVLEFISKYQKNNIINIVKPSS